MLGKLFYKSMLFGYEIFVRDNVVFVNRLAENGEPLGQMTMTCGRKVSKRKIRALVKDWEKEAA